MVSRSILLCFSFALLKLSFTLAFQTDQCDHTEIIEALGKLQKCLEQEYDDDDGEDVCFSFRKAGECVKPNLGECLSKNAVERSAKETVADLQQTQVNLYTLVGIGIGLSEKDIKKFTSLVDACPNMPEKSFSENLKAKAFYVLDAAVKTDMNCPEDQITKFNIDLGECEKMEVHKALPQIGRMIQSGRINPPKVCSILSETVGKCWRKPLPDCLSWREEAFLKTETIRDGIDGLKEFVYQAGADGTITFPECPVFSTENIFPFSKSEYNSQYNSESRIIPLSKLFYITAIVAYFCMNITCY